jgi:hypothetical protein
MSRINVLGALVLGASLGIGCGGDRAEVEAEDAKTAEVNIEDTAPLEETGCLTAAGDRFVLAALESGRTTETELYQLVGREEELRQHVGKSVRVTGDAEPAQVAELRESSGAVPTTGEPPSAEGQPQQAPEAQVQTQAQTRLETRRMRVVTVTPTGDDCAVAAN